ncbi:MAG: hypothetical protein JXB47_19160 [Anaerolineae bacterium]|nr:hypothetical protein [Anaerolineae bacterium]
MQRKVPLVILICAGGLLLTACFQSTGLPDLSVTSGDSAVAEADQPTPEVVFSPTVETLPQGVGEAEEAQTPAAVAYRPSDALRSPTAHIIVITATPGICPTCPPCEVEGADASASVPLPAPEVAQTEEAQPPIAPTPTLPTPVVLPAPPEGCPTLVPEMSMAPMLPSNDLRAIPQHIDFFLSDGGTVSRLRDGLAAWEVLAGPGDLIEGAFDGKAGKEIAMAVQMLAPGMEAYNVWVFDCQGQVLYQAFPGARERPVALMFRDLDGDASRLELFFGLETCNGSCQVAWRGIKWVGPSPGETVDLLRNLPVFKPNFTPLEFLTGPSGALAVRFTEQATVQVDAPPERDIVYDYVLTGGGYSEGYTLATQRYTEPVYRHQMLRAGDEAIRIDLQLAIDRYWDAVYNAGLRLWPSESAADAYNGVNAFARYRVMQTLLLRGDRAGALQAHDELMALYATQPGAADIARFADDFWKLYNDVASANLSIACDAGGQIPSYGPARQAAQNYGFIRGAEDFCPF